MISSVSHTAWVTQYLPARTTRASLTLLRLGSFFASEQNLLHSQLGKDTSIFWYRQAKNMLAVYYIAAYLWLHALSCSVHTLRLRVRFSYMRAWIWTWVMKYSWLRCRKILQNENPISVWDCLPCRKFLISFIPVVKFVIFDTISGV